MKSGHLFVAFIILSVFLSCTVHTPQTGVSLSLAQERSASIDSLRYSLHFNIPEDISTAITAIGLTHENGIVLLRFYFKVQP